MTYLEQLIRQQVSAALVTSLNRTIDKIADEMAQEILKDPVFRHEMERLIKSAFAEALQTLPKDAEGS